MTPSIEKTDEEEMDTAWRLLPAPVWLTCALVRNVIPEELGRFNSFHYVRGISIFGHEKLRPTHPRAESGGFYDGWPKKRPLIALVEQFRIIRFPLFSLPVFPAFARTEAQSLERRPIFPSEL